jgi:hypothetical protein
MKIYLSLTSIFNNQQQLCETLRSIQTQTLQPDCCYLYLSETSYLLDSGFPDRILNKELKNIIDNNNIQLCWTENIGPYRKLLPLLHSKQNEDCIIITIDDDTVYSKTFVQNYIDSYIKHNCVIAHRSHSLIINDIEHMSYMNRKTTKDQISLYNFHTGKGGVLYHPKFFGKSMNHIFDSSIYNACCPYGDDIWFNFHRIINSVNCYIPEEQSYIKDNTTCCGLWNNINSKNDLNTISMRKTAQTLKHLGYSI